MKAAIVALMLLIVAQSKTTMDGVYSAAQAKRGEAVYEKSCASCHAADLSGSGQASPLAGNDFNEGWNGQTLADLFDRIQTTMPADAPGSLKPAENADVIAFLLSKAEMPAGEMELAPDVAALKEIKFAVKK